MSSMDKGENLREISIVIETKRKHKDCDQSRGGFNEAELQSSLFRVA